MFAKCSISAELNSSTVVPICAFLLIIIRIDTLYVCSKSSNNEGSLGLMALYHWYNYRSLMVIRLPYCGIAYPIIQQALVINKFREM